MSNDLVNELLNLGPDDSGFREVGVAAATALTEARAEIERMNAQVDEALRSCLAEREGRLKAETAISTLRARVREVVEPFADLAQRYDDTVSDGWVSWAEFVADHAWPTETNCRAARQLNEDLK